jgi:hypothetical protein
MRARTACEWILSRLCFCVRDRAFARTRQASMPGPFAGSSSLSLFESVYLVMHCSADRPRHQYLFIARATHSDAHPVMPRTSTMNHRIGLSLACPLPRVEDESEVSARESKSFRAQALCYRAAQQLDLAIATIQKAIAKDPSNCDSSYILFEVHPFLDCE